MDREKKKKVFAKRLSAYKSNVKLMLSSLMMGIGGKDVKTLLTFMDLPHSKNFGKNAFHTLEEEIGEVIRDVAVLQMKKALDEEVRLTLEKKHNEWEETKDGPEPLTYAMWKILPDNHPDKKVKIVVCFDMGWQKRGFTSLSGHAFMIGGLSRKVLDCIICAKQCAKCQRAKSRGQTSAKKHKCPKNHGGSSKAMEADACLILTTRLY